MKITIQYKNGPEYGMGEHSDGLTMRPSLNSAKDELTLELIFQPAIEGITTYHPVSASAQKSKARVGSAKIQMSSKQAEKLARFLLWALEQANEVKPEYEKIKLSEKQL